MKAIGGPRWESYLRKAAVALGFRGYPGVSVGFGGQISCKSQGNLTFASQFLGFTGVSVLLVVKSLANHRVSLL